MVGLSAAFPATSLTQISATVDEDVTALDSASINRSGLFNSNTVAIGEVSLDVSGNNDEGISMAIGNGKLCVAYRDADTIEVRIYTLGADGIFTATGGNTITGLARTNAAGQLFTMYSGESDDFIIAYQHDNSAKYSIRVAQLAGASITFGTAVVVNSGTATTFYFGEIAGVPIAIEYGGTAYKYTKSGTGLTEVALTIDTSHMNANPVICREVNGKLLCVTVDVSVNLELSLYSLSGTTMTLDDSLVTSIATTTIDNNSVKIIQSNSDEFLIAYNTTGGTPDVYCFGGLANASLSAESSATLVSAGSVANIIDGAWHTAQGRYALSYIDDNVLIVKEVTQGTDVVTIALQSTTLTLETAVTFNNSGQDSIRLVYDSTNGFFFQGVNESADVSLLRFKDSIPFYKIGIFKDTALSGAEATVHIKRSLMGILSEDYSGLTKGTNYYIGDAGLVTTSASGPFFGWAIDADAVVVSENALS